MLRGLPSKVLNEKPSCTEMARRKVIYGSCTCLDKGSIRVLTSSTLRAACVRVCTAHTAAPTAAPTAAGQESVCYTDVMSHTRDDPKYLKHPEWRVTAEVPVYADCNGAEPKGEKLGCLAEGATFKESERRALGGDRVSPAG